MAVGEKRKSTYIQVLVPRMLTVLAPEVVDAGNALGTERCTLLRKDTWNFAE